MSVYDRPASTALKLISKYGIQYTFEHIDRGEYEPDLGATVGDVATEYTSQCVITDFTKSFLPNAVTEKGDVALLATTASFFINDTTRVAGKKFRILIAEPLNPGGTILLYKLQLRA